jgi:hypothetical protein
MKTFLSAAALMSIFIFGWANPGRPDDSNAPGWKTYENPKLGIQMAYRSSWRSSEYSDATNSGAVLFVVSRAPGPDVTVTVSRDKVDPRFEVPTSSRALAALYAPGYRQSSARLAGREATLVEGTLLADGRREQSYYLRKDGYDYRVAFTAPEDHWRDFSEIFETIRKSIAWLSPAHPPESK